MTQVRQITFGLCVLGAVMVFFYYKDLYHSSFFVRSGEIERPGDSKCSGMNVIEACRREELIKILFVTDTEVNHIEERNFARNSYATQNFARHLKWLTVFRLVETDFLDGNNEKYIVNECEKHGDIVASNRTKSARTFHSFVSWILEYCPNVDLVVHMKDIVIPHPFYLPNYRVLHMDHQPEVIHCHYSGDSQAGCRHDSVLMTKKRGLQALAENATEVDGRIITESLTLKNMGSYVAINENMTLLYTIGAVIFYTYPPDIKESMMSLWTTMMSSPQNTPSDLRL